MLMNPQMHIPGTAADPDSTCIMCGAVPGDSWETEPLRSVQLVLGARFWDIPEAALPLQDQCILCDECEAGVEGLRKAGVPRSR